MQPSVACIFYDILIIENVSLFCLGLHARTVLLGIMRSLPSTFCQMVLLPFVGDASEIYFLEWSCDA